MEEGQPGPSDGWEGARDGRSNGWPMGLARVSIASASSALLISTPSLTSFSSSDFDSESTGSFFPEKSTTLGSLIGIQASSQFEFTEDEISSMEGEKTRRKGTGWNSQAWWSLLGCRGGLRDDTVDISPSLAHFLDNERTEASSQRQTTGNNIEHAYEEQGQGQDERFHSDEIVSHRSGSPYDNAGIITSRPRGPSLRFILQQPSPTSYLSTDWNVFSDLSQNHHIRGHSSPGHGRFQTFWPSLCGRLGTGAAN